MELLDICSRYVPDLKKNGGECHGTCHFCSAGTETLRVGETWRTLCCCAHEESGNDAIGFLASWENISREEAAKLIESGNLPPPHPIDTTLRKAPFCSIPQLTKRPDDRVWIHDNYDAMRAARELVPERIHIALIPGRSWADLRMLKNRHVVLVPTNTAMAIERMERLADCLYDAGHDTVRWVKPLEDAPEHWTLVDAQASGATPEQVMAWARDRVRAYPKNDAAQQDNQAGEASATVPSAKAPSSGSLPNTSGPTAAASPNAAPPELPAFAPAHPSVHSSSGSGLSRAAEAQQPGGAAPDTSASPKANKSNGGAFPQARKQGNGASSPLLTPAQRVAAQHEADTAAVLGSVIFTCIADVQPEAVKWLWPGRIPLGELTMIVGDPGLGKSQICASLASVVTNGGQWPVDRNRAEVGSVLILSAEDNIKHTIRPRLDAAGADVTRCHTLQAIRRNTQEGNPYESGFSLAEDLSKLSILMYHLGDVRLVVIDPVSAYLGETDSHKNAEVRGMLAPLTTLAGQHNAAIILVSHLTKSQSANALMRVQGSIAFAALCRAVWGVARDKDSQERRLFMPLKNNLGQDKSGLAYAIEPFTLDGEEPIPTSRIMWEAQAVEMGAEEAFSGNLSHEERTEVDEAKDFLREALSEGRVKSVDVRKAALAAGHKDTTLGRAKRALKIKSEREGFAKDAIWYWRLDAPAAKDQVRDWQPD